MNEEDRNIDQNRSGLVFNIQNYSLHDGPGIRTIVFLKGCPLNCRWCCNPESISSGPELGLRHNLCNKCGLCLNKCPQKALSLDEGTDSLKVGRALCDGCGVCIEACSPKALTIYGQRMTVEDVVDEVMKDAPFYRRSGGGVTISGGEPLRQIKFLLGILEACKQNGLHTVIETSGYCSPETLSRVLDKTDLFLFDLKVMDDARHLELTGQRNHLILDNARLLAREGCAVQPRMPLIPGINDSADNLRTLASFLESVGWNSIELMPYHQFGKGKYAALGRPYAMDDDVTSAGTEDIERTCNLLKEYGIDCWAST
ncbi:glycyl-radical enzyme activating protein [Thermodesulfobacteriota bacterium]